MMDNKKFDTTYLFGIIFIGLMLVLFFFLLQKIFVNRDSSIINRTEINEEALINMMPIPGFIPNEKDERIEVNFLVPDDMIEDKEVAKKIGVYKIYKSNSKKIDPQSFVSASFSKRKAGSQDLANFIYSIKLNLELHFPGQKMNINQLHLPKDVVEKFETMKIPYYAAMFLIDKGVNNSGYNCASFFFSIPSGYWLINWIAPRKILKHAGRERDMFLTIIKYLAISEFNPNTKNLTIIM